MSSLFRPSFLGLLFVLAARVVAAVPLTNLVDEQSPVVISLHDVPALVKNWGQNPWSKTWNDTQIKKFLAPLRAQMKVDAWDELSKAENGHTVSELLAMAKGDALIALTGVDFPLGDTAPADLPLLALIELGSNAKSVAAVITKADEKGRNAPTTEDFAGVTLHLYHKSSDEGGAEKLVWAMADGIWFISPSKATVQKAIDALQRGRCATPLGESERFLRIKKQNPDAQLTLAVNMPALFPLLKNAIEARAQSTGAQPLGLPPGTILDAVGLDKINDCYLSALLGEDNTQFRGGLTYSELRGLFKLLAYRDGPVAQPAFVSAKWITATSACFSLPDAYAALRGFIDSLNPLVGGIVQGQIKSFNNQLGIDLERDLIGSLGAKLIVASAMPPGASADKPAPLTAYDQLYALALDNSPAFAKSVDALKRLAGPEPDKLFTKREYLGQTIFTAVTAQANPGQKTFSYAITPQYVFIAVGTSAILETALQGLDGKQPSLWQQPDVKAALADVPANACVFQYQNTRAMMGGIIETLLQIAPLMAGQTGADADDSEDTLGKPNRSKSPFDLTAKPDAAAVAKYWNTSTGFVTRDSHGLYFNSTLSYAK